MGHLEFVDGPSWFGYIALSTKGQGEGLYVNRLGVKPRGFPWISRTRLGYHRDDALLRYPRSRSGRPQPPMPAVAPFEQREGY